MLFMRRVYVTVAPIPEMSYSTYCMYAGIGVPKVPGHKIRCLPIAKCHPHVAWKTWRKWGVEANRGVGKSRGREENLEKDEECLCVQRRHAV